MVVVVDDRYVVIETSSLLPTLNSLFLLLDHIETDHRPKDIKTGYLYHKLLSEVREGFKDLRHLQNKKMNINEKTDEDIISF